MLRGQQKILLNADDLEALVGLGVDKVLALHFERDDGGGSAGESTDGRSETTVGLESG